MPPAMKAGLADLQLPRYRFHRRALVEVHLRLAQLRDNLLRRMSLPFHRVLPPSRALDSHITWYICRGSGHGLLRKSVPEAKRSIEILDHVLAIIDYSSTASSSERLLPFILRGVW